jgi:C_GCAxxG_C_C family probable redox protein
MTLSLTGFQTLSGIKTKNNQMKKSQLAIENFKTLNCAQSVLLSFAKELNLDEMTALRISAGFGGGMAMAETCGAVTGAYMVLGLKAQTEGKSIPEIKAEAKAAVKKFNDIFRTKHGSQKCKKLLGINISTSEGAAEASEKNLFDSVCVGLVGSATEILEKDF